MPVSADWYDKQTREIIFWKISDKWSPQELHTVYDKTDAMTLTVSHWVHAIIDMQQADTFPSGVISSVTLRSRADPPNYDMAVIITASPFIRAMCNILATLNRGNEKFYIVDTLEEALIFVAKRKKILLSYKKN